MKANHLLLIICLFCSLAACQEADPFQDVLYFTGTETSPANTYTVDGPAEIGITVSASCLPTTNQIIQIEVDSNKLDSYNKENGKKYKLLPSKNYLLSGNEIVLEAGTNVSNQLMFSLLNTDGFEEGAIYCIPLSITHVSGGLPVLEASRTTYIVLNQTIITNAAKSVNMPIPFETSEVPQALSECTMEARVMVTKFASGSPFISTVMGVEEHFLLRFGDTTIKPNQIQLAGGGYPVTSQTEFETNKWYHVAVVYDGSTIKLYINGKIDGQTDAPRGPINLCGTTDKRRFCIGGSLNSRLLNGYISEVRVWKKALSANELQNNMCFVAPEDYPSMIAYWKFNEGSGSTVIKDWTGNGWDISKNLTFIPGVRCPE